MTRLIYNSPIGPLLVAADDGHIVEVSFMEADTRSKFRRSADDVASLHDTATNNAATSQKEKEALAADTAIAKACIAELEAYFAGTLKVFTVPIKQVATEFRMRAWKGIMAIPYGETVSYTKLAQNINQPRAIRSAGTASRNNPISIIVPCHRVIGAHGELTGYAGGLDSKDFLLQLEKKHGKTHENH